MSNRMKGLPFRPVKAVPVDLFPHSPHCELVLVFERISSTMAQHSPLTEPLVACSGSPKHPLPSGDEHVVAHT